MNTKLAITHRLLAASNVARRVEPYRPNRLVASVSHLRDQHRDPEGRIVRDFDRETWPPGSEAFG